jgi:hypothetical protein
MKILKGLLTIMIILSFTKAFAGSPEQTFWKWFEKNQNMLFNFEEDREAIFDKLSSVMHKVHSDLTFEFSPVFENGTREFVISAGGIKKAFPAVESLYDSAPQLQRWKFIKFRPRRNPINNVSFGNKTIAAKDVYYKMFKDEEKIGLLVFINGYNEKEHNTYANIGYLFLDEALGEECFRNRLH